MNNTKHKQCILNIPLVLFCLLTPSLSDGKIDRFVPLQGGTTEVWRITHDPTVRDWANYHNTQCWSPDGRYLTYTHYASDGKEFGTSEAAEIHLFDFLKDEDIRIDNGTNPRWANNHNWLFYTRSIPDDGPSDGKGTQVMWMDVENQTVKRIAYGVTTLKETDYQDRWLYGLQGISNDRKPVRIAIKEDSRLENIHRKGKNLYGGWLSVNPRHPVIVSRDYMYPDFNYATEGTRDIPMRARHHVLTDLEGGNRTDTFPIMDGSHFSWSGDGSYFMCGNGQMRGILWNEFLPGNIHFLASIRAGDICMAGRSGRWICGSTSGGRGPLVFADLRSGDGWTVMKTHSVICYPGSEDNSGPYDIDAKGSPDGTKVAFISNYDLKVGPFAVVAEDAEENRIVVESTEGFPNKGRLVAVTGFQREVLSYSRKTPTSFEKLDRGLYGTPVSSPRKGQTVTLFESRLIPEKQWKDLPLPAKSIRNIIGDMDSPLMRQRSSDIYIAIVRKPDPPHLRDMGGRVELIPGENHWETQGYHLFLDDEKITDSPVLPGASIYLDKPGTYTAAAVEWSGLESPASLPLVIEQSATLKILENKPADFSWTGDRWSVNGEKVSRKAAMHSEKARRKIVHLHDGVIHKEWYNWGKITKRYDLNLEGKPIRHLYYQSGKLARRELHKRNGDIVSAEYFDNDGYITESIQYRTDDGKTMETNHRWYKNAVPVKVAVRGSIYKKDGSKWVKKF